MIYPLAECFASWQGEGVFAGTAMFFIRLAGCNVGKPYTPVDGNQWASLPVYTDKCTLYDGRTFPCDTDYRKTERVDEAELMRRVPSGITHICITGGEPLMHDLKPLISALNFAQVHIETSGTKIIGDLPGRPWITVSPKMGVISEMLMRADEFKFLVDKDFNPNFEIRMTSPLILAALKPAYLQPINYENEINVENLKLCLEWQKKYPVFRISPQYHKMVSHYVEETIR